MEIEMVVFIVAYFKFIDIDVPNQLAFNLWKCSVRGALFQSIRLSKNVCHSYKCKHLKYWKSIDIEWPFVGTIIQISIVPFFAAAAAHKHVRCKIIIIILPRCPVLAWISHVCDFQLMRWCQVTCSAIKLFWYYTKITYSEKVIDVHREKCVPLPFSLSLTMCVCVCSAVAGTPSMTCKW